MSIYIDCQEPTSRLNRTNSILRVSLAAETHFVLIAKYTNMILTNHVPETEWSQMFALPLGLAIYRCACLFMPHVDIVQPPR